MARIIGTAGSAPKARKVVKRAAVTHAPVTDVQSSGGDYGTHKAAKFKRTRVYKQEVAAAKPSRQTDASSSGPGYGGPKARAYTARVALARASVAAAKAYKPFNFAHVRDAIHLGLPEADGLSINHQGRIQLHHKNRWGGIGGGLADKLSADTDIVLNPRKGGNPDALYGDTAHGAPAKAGLDAAGEAVLKETARPLHAIAGLANAGTHGFTEGLLHNKPYTFGTALKKAGLPSGVAGPVGFVADVAADPTTYVTFGAGSVARHAAERAGEDAVARAARTGMSEAGQKTVARAAAKKAEAAAPAGKGVTVKMAGRSVPGVTRATAAAGRTVKRTAAKAPKPVKAVAGGVRNAASDVRPQMARAGESQVAHVAVRSAGRQARAEARVGMAQAERHARALKKLVPADQYEGVISAIERNKLGELPAELRGPARDVRDSLRHAKRVRARAGIPEGDVTLAKGDGAAVNYFPHALADELKAGQGVHESVPLAQTKGRRVVRLSSSKKRADLRPISEQNPERLAAGEAPFSTNLPLVHGEYMAGTAKAVASRNLAANLARIGRPLKEHTVLEDGDAVFHFHNGELTPIKGEPKSLKAGRYVVLNQKTVEREFANIAPQTDRSAIGTIFDRGTGGFKRLATLTPGFHARNLVGDTQMAYLAQPGHRLPGNVIQAGKAVKRLSRTEAHQEKSLAPLARTADTIKVGATHRNVDDFLAEAQKHGVIRSGYVGRELQELGKGKTKRVGGTVRAQVGSRVNRWMQNREDLMRLATYKHGLDTGLSPQEAADLSLGVHIDYGDLTGFERRVARRAAPFYTFSARALPIHVKALVTKPGKFANIEKFREEAATTTGLNLQDEEKHLKTFEARQAPLILNIGGKKTVLSDSLPLTLLNEVPAGTSPGQYISELSQWMASLANPIIKDPIELYSNRSFFFRSDIESPNSPLVAAPSWVSAIYKYDKGLAKQLGIVPDYVDKQSGKKTWGWRGKSDYIFKSVPGAINFGQQLLTQGNRRGQSEAQKIGGFFTGVKAEPLDPVGAAMEVLFKAHDAVAKEAAAFNRRAKTGANVRAAAILRAKQREIERQLSQLSSRRGDSVPMYSNAAGAHSTEKIDVRLADLRAREAQLKKAGQATENGGYATKAYAGVQQEIAALEKQRTSLLGRKSQTVQVKRRPLTPQERSDARTQQRLSRMQNLDQSVQDRINRRLERLQVDSGG